MQTLTFDELLRSFKQNKDAPHSILLGAGASVESGVKTAIDCIWEWKKDIFLSQNPVFINFYFNLKEERVRNIIQRWLDGNGIYPQNGSEDEYSFYAEKALPIPDDRRRYFQKLVAGKKPSIGYHIIALLAEKGLFRSVWTTNFDGLMLKCAHNYNIIPIEVTAETGDRIYLGNGDRELLCIALHGDYKYGKLKNVASELDSQYNEFIEALSHELKKRDLLVIGYSGRDKSLMNALTLAYQKKGTGKLFWCGYGNNVSIAVRNLIDSINNSGRSAFYVATEGFDKTLYNLARYCMSDDVVFLNKLDRLKNELASTFSETKTKFEKPIAKETKIINTNVFPFAFPANCYQFEIKYTNNEKPWDFCKYLATNDIMAVPHNNFLYAWGEKNKIENLCKGKIIGEITLSPFTRELPINIGPFKELLIKTLTAIIGKNNSLPYSKDKIWDPAQKIVKKIGDPHFRF